MHLSNILIAVCFYLLVRLDFEYLYFTSTMLNSQGLSNTFRTIILTKVRSRCSANNLCFLCLQTSNVPSRKTYTNLVFVLFQNVCLASFNLVLFHLVSFWKLLESLLNPGVLKFHSDIIKYRYVFCCYAEN